LHFPPIPVTSSFLSSASLTFPKSLITEICTIKFFNSELPVVCYLKRLVEILDTIISRSWQSLFFFLNQEHKNCTTQNHSPTTARTPLFALRTALARFAPPSSLVTTVALHFVSSQTSRPVEHTCNPSFGMLLSPLRNPSIWTPLSPLRNPSFGTLLSPLRNLSFGMLLPPLRNRNFGMSLSPLRNPNFGMSMLPLQNPSFGTLLSSLRNPNFGTLLSPLRNPRYGTLLQPLFSRLKSINFY